MSDIIQNPTELSRDNEMAELLSMSPDELVMLMQSIGEPRYRAEQIFSGMSKGLSPDMMTNLSKTTKEKLSRAAYFFLPTVEMKLVSKLDGTIKYLFGLKDGNCVEAVIMKYNHGNTICVSSQVGCRMGCKFCASTIGGKVRDLTAGEILGEVISAIKDSGERISNIVMMGIGEPLDNYENVLKFLKLVNNEKGLGIGYRHISLSTCGVVPGIRRLASEDLPITLSISLHAPDDATRSEIMPINRSYNIASLMDACRDYYSENGRRISFEYTLIAGKNDSVEKALSLAGLLNGSLRRKGDASMPIHVNLIPVNSVTETGFTHSGRKAVADFERTLESKGIRATVRRTLGQDINASCGQLRRQKQQRT